MFSERQSKSIKKRLIDKGKTITDMAREIGEPRTYVSSVLNRALASEKIENKIIQYKISLDKKGE